MSLHPMCDCGACCDACGHDPGCMSWPPEEPEEEEEEVERVRDDNKNWG